MNINENTSMKEVLNQLRNSEYWVRQIVAAYLGVEPGDVCLPALCKTENFGGGFSTLEERKNPRNPRLTTKIKGGGKSPPPPVPRK